MANSNTGFVSPRRLEEYNSGAVTPLYSSIAGIETSPTQGAHAAGSFLYYNGRLYKAKAAIAEGAALSVGTNIERATVTEVLRDLSSLNVASQGGANGIRYYNDKLEYWDGSSWVEIETGGGGIQGFVTAPTISGASTWVYDGTEHAPTLSGLDTDLVEVSGTVKSTNAGEFTITLTLKNSNSYVWTDLTNAPKTLTWSITKATFTATASVAAYPYAGTKGTPAVSNNPGGGSVQFYARDTQGGAATAWESVTATTFNAGTHYIYAVIGESENYQGLTTADAAFTVNKGTFTSSVQVAGYTYGGAKSTPSVTNNPGGGSVTYYGRASSGGSATAWGDVTGTTFDAGTRYCYAVIAESTNYLGLTTGETSFNIAKASFSSEVSISDYTYGGTKSAPSVTNNPGGGAVSFYGRSTSTGAGTAWGSVTGTTFDAGTRYCYAVIAESTNYLGLTTANKSFTIAKANGAATLSKSSVSLTADSPTATVTVSGNTGSVGTPTSSDSGVATASVSGSTVTITAVATGSCTISIPIAASTNYEATTKTVIVEASMIMVYGAEWDGSSSTVWSRTDAAEGFTNPVPAVNNGTGSSPFDSISPWKDIRRVTDSAAGELVEIPKFYYKWTISGSKMKLQVSAANFDGASVSPMHMDRGDGAGERSVAYVGRYHCATSTYKSTTGVKPVANITRSAARTSIHNLGSDIWQWDYATLTTIWMLYLVEFADWNSQKTIGYGCGNNSSTENMGSTDAMQYHTGTNAANRTTYGHTQYRYIEDLWGNVLDWCDGIYFAGTNKTDVYAIKKPSDFSDTANGTKVGTRPNSGNYISAWKVSDVSGFGWFMYPSAVSGTDSTYVGDYCSYYSSGVVLFVGGDYVQNQYRGLFCLYGGSAASGSYGCVGSRLLKLPMG